MGAWGSPNTGKILIRNPTLVASAGPPAKRELSDTEEADLEAMADLKFGAPEAEGAFLAAKYPLGRFWTVVIVYVAFIVVALFGWRMVGPSRNSPSN